MDILFVLLPLSIVLALIALAAYIWASSSGQFDDLETPPRRMMGDDD